MDEVTTGTRPEAPARLATATPTPLRAHLPSPRLATRRSARPRHYLTAAPDHLAVTYAINPWMDPSAPFDHERAVAQWHGLVGLYRRLGHRVDVLPATPGLPDLVFAANGAFTVDGRALLSRFRHPERRGEEAVHLAWLAAQGLHVEQVSASLEGEGDLLLAGDLVLAGTGPRTDRLAHEELRRWLAAAPGGRAPRLEVVTLELVNPRFYHLDTALGVVSDDVVAWYPPALSVAACDEVSRRFPHAIVVDDHDAGLLACNLVSDGRNVVIPQGADHLASDLVAAGFVVHEVDTSELLLAGGGPKCMTAELHR